MKQALLPGMDPGLLTEDEDLTGPGESADEEEKTSSPSHDDQHLLPGFSLPGYTLVGLLNMTDGDGQPRPVEGPPQHPVDSHAPQPDDMRVFEPAHAGPGLPPITVVGLGLNEVPANPAVLRVVREAEVLAVPKRLIGRYRRYRALCIPLVPPLEAALAALEEHRRQGRRCVILADGDPLLFGIGGTLARRYGSPSAADRGKDGPQTKADTRYPSARITPQAHHALRILPEVSAMQTACARVALPWHEVIPVSLHGRNEWRPLAHAAVSGRPVCVYTDAARGPAHIARFLLERGVDWYRMVVAANLRAMPDAQESIRDMPLHEAARQDFAGGETVLLLPDGPVRGPRPGMDESSLVLDGGLYTKAPIRAAALSLLSPAPDAVLWDIGAGSGCFALEAAALVPRGWVCAVEREPDRVLCIQENRRRVGVPHLDILTAEAPLGLDGLPDPDGIFLGGGLGEGLHRACADSAENGGANPARRTRDRVTCATLLLNALMDRLRPGGTLVAACALLSSLERITTYLDAHGLPFTVTQVQASVSSPLAGSLTLKALNPVFLVQTRKQR